ncbi:MAG: MaoC family dehydratase N-terminal domain-containing protein [Clostridia bacterium]|nr:MaoC family dehydratase N-terminal domain-containing protein [Clostridia bacterium]
MYLDDFVIGTELEIPSVEIDPSEMVQFAKRYDPFTVHLDRQYAERSRFGDLISPGLYSFLVVWKQFVDCNLFGDELVAGKSTKVEWFKPVYGGDVLSGKARIVNVTRRNPYNGIAEIVIEVRNQNREIVLVDRTEAVVLYRPKQN